MAKRKPKSKVAAPPKWKTQWPRNGELSSWFRCMLRKCDAISDDVAAADRSHLPIEHLAEMGHVAEALRHVNRYLRRLPKERALPTVRMATLGAKVCLDAGDEVRMESYLAIAEATAPYNTRKCDVGFSINAVREFRAENGILDPEDAIDDEQRVEATFWRARRRFRQSLKQGKRKQAKEFLAEMESAAREAERDSMQSIYLEFVVDSFAELNDSGATQQLIRRLTAAEREEILDARRLVNLGLQQQAIKRAEKDIRSELKELSEMTDPNIHFPAMAICRSLKLLVELDERTVARRWLRRSLKEMPTWPAFEYGWTTSAVYKYFAEATALIDGPDAAKQLLEQATADGKAEKRSGFRKAAVNATLDLKADIGLLDEAIAEACKLRSPTQRRKELGRLLARAKRWKELREVLSEVASPEEAADVAWWIKFELPGGEVK